MKLYKVLMGGVIGVPKTYIDIVDYSLFTLLGLTESEGKGVSNGIFIKDSEIKHGYMNSKKTYARVFIRRNFK